MEEVINMIIKGANTEIDSVELKRLSEYNWFKDPKYMDIWKELAELMVEECPSVSLGSLISGWYHKPELHVDYQGAECYWYNTYWDNPSKHAKNY